MAGEGGFGWGRESSAQRKNERDIRVLLLEIIGFRRSGAFPFGLAASYDRKPIGLRPRCYLPLHCPAKQKWNISFLIRNIWFAKNAPPYRIGRLQTCGPDLGSLPFLHRFRCRRKRHDDDSTCRTLLEVDLQQQRWSAKRSQDPVP